MKKMIKTLVLGILLCTLFLGRTGVAAEDTYKNGQKYFEIDAQLLSVDNITYDIQLTLSNRGENWEGTVRVQMDISYDSLSCAYDTALSLPQGSTKQFVVSIPVKSIEDQDEAVRVSLLDKNEQVVAENYFKRLLMDGSDVLSLGILSDSYSSLTYLDMGGENIYYGGIELPINLIALNQDNLTGFLDFLTYLVIDNYNTSVLTDEALDEIDQWVDDGGMLIVGTGEHAEDTLSALDFLGIECDRVNKPREGLYGGDYAAGLEQLSLAELKDTTGRYYTDSDSLIMIRSRGDGAMEVVPYALSDLGRSDLMIEDWESYAWELLQNVNSYARIVSNYGKGFYNSDYVIQRIFKSFGNGSNRLNFGVLKLIVIAYVIFVGPILYLILRFLKKRDWYWWSVPATMLAAILLIYFAGRGFEVADTRVYSVTVEKLSGQGDSMTYMHCYDAGYKEWGLQLADRYEYVGPVFGNYYYSSDDGKYHYHVHKEGDRISFGMDPDKSFEDSYFMAGTSQKTVTGVISGELTTSAQWGITGTVTNQTDWDFDSFAVIDNNTLYVYDKLAAGGTYSLKEAVYTSRKSNYDTVIDAYRQGYMNNYDLRKNRDYDIMAALGVGISVASNRGDLNGTVIIGIIKDWDKTVNDICSETSYGCLYSVQ